MNVFICQAIVSLPFDWKNPAVRANLYWKLFPPSFHPPQKHPNVSWSQLLQQGQNGFLKPLRQMEDSKPEERSREATRT